MIGSAGTPQSPRARMSVQPKPTRKRRSGLWISLLLIVAVLAGFTYYKWDGIYGFVDDKVNPAAALEMPIKPSFISDDGKVMVAIPDHARGEVTDVTFAYDKKHFEQLSQGQLPLSWLGAPVDIKPIGGTLKSDKVAVTIKYDPKRLPKGFTATQLGMVVYDTNMEAWVPILNAKADAKTHSVTALAPHFSQFGVIMVNPLKQLEVFGSNLKIALNKTMSVAQAVFAFVKGLTTEMVKHLFAQVDPVACKPASKRVETQDTIWKNVLTSCVQASGDTDMLRVGNSLGFPLLTETLPAGIELDITDIVDGGPSVADLVRSTFWAAQHKAYIASADQTTFNVTSALPQKASLKLDVDSEAIAFDVGLAVLMVIAPEGAGAKAAATKALKEVQAGKKISDLTGTGMAWFSKSYDFMDCVVGLSHETLRAKVGLSGVSADEMYTNDGVNEAVKLADNCLGSILGGMDLKGALADLLSNLKLIPEVITSTIYVAAGAATETINKLGGQLDDSDPEIVLNRISEPLAQEPAQEETPQDADPSGQADIGDFAGVWYLQSGGTLTITKQWGGELSRLQFIDKSIDERHAGWNKVKVAIAVAPGMEGNTLDVWTGDHPTYKDRSGKTYTPSGRVQSLYKGKAFKLAPTDDKHVLLATVQTATAGPVMGNLCDKYAYTKATAAGAYGTKYYELCR